MFKLFLDPGHGDSDSGAVGNGLLEKDLTLSIALKIREILANEYNDVVVKMSRTGDTFPSLNQRTNDANNWGATFFLSIHINSGGGTGFETFTYPGVTKIYQNAIHDEIMKIVGLTDRGKKQQDLHVLRESNMSAVLTENGFIDSTNDSAKMKDSNWINAVARAHVVGLEKAFNLQRKVTVSNLQQNVTIVTGGVGVEGIKEMSAFLISKKWYAKLIFPTDTSPYFEIGQFPVGSATLAEMEAWLKSRNWYYEKR